MNKNQALVLFVGLGLIGSHIFNGDVRLILGIMLIGWSVMTEYLEKR